MTPEEQQQVNDTVEAFRAQRTEALDKQVHWFAQYMAATRRIKELESKVAELTPTSPVKLEAVE